MSATFDFYGSIRLQQIDRPGLRGIHAENEDGVLAIELTGDCYRWKGVGLARCVGGVACAHPHRSLRIGAIVGWTLGSEIDGEVAVAEAVGRGGRIILPVGLREVAAVDQCAARRSDGTVENLKDAKWDDHPIGENGVYRLTGERLRST
jgi:hypothetical protein